MVAGSHLQLPVFMTVNYVGSGLQRSILNSLCDVFKSDNAFFLTGVNSSIRVPIMFNLKGSVRFYCSVVLGWFGATVVTLHQPTGLVHI